MKKRSGFGSDHSASSNAVHLIQGVERIALTPRKAAEWYGAGWHLLTETHRHIYLPRRPVKVATIRSITIAKPTYRS